jgi:hypothetical protein
MLSLALGGVPAERSEGPGAGAGRFAPLIVTSRASSRLMVRARRVRSRVGAELVE